LFEDQQFARMDLQASKPTAIVGHIAD